jgi:WD40 repeat protein
VWDVQSGTCIHTLRGHNDEILDVSFNATGSKLVTASADGNSRVYNTMTGACHAILAGHEGEISKVAFNPQGSRILTASSDKTARLWETETGDCLQVNDFCDSSLINSCPCFRSWKVTQTKYSVAHLITKVTQSLQDQRIILAEYGNVNFVFLDSSG